MIMLDTSFSSDPSPNIKEERAKRGRPRKNILLDYAIESKNIKGLKIGDDIFLCFNQLIESVLKHIPPNAIHEACFILGVKYKKSNNSIKKLMKTANAIHSKEKECNLIKIKDAEKLCNFLLQKDTSLLIPSLMTHAFHDYFGGCEGTYIFDMDVAPRSRCIKCNQCSLLFSAQRFLCHSHVLGTEKRDLSSDPLNWDDFVFIRIEEETYPLSFYRKSIRKTSLENSTDLFNLSSTTITEDPHSISEPSSPTTKSDGISNDSSNFPYNLNRVFSSTDIIPTEQKSCERRLGRPTSIKSSEMLQNVFSPHSISEPSSPTTKLDGIFNDSSNFPYNVNRVSSALTNRTPTKQKSYKKRLGRPRKHGKATNMKSSEMLHSVFSPALTHFISMENALNHPVSKLFPTTLKSFDFSTTKSKPAYLSTVNIEPSVYANSEIETIVFSDTKAKLFEFLASETKPLDLSTTKNKSLDFSVTKFNLLDFSATKTKSLDFSATEAKPLDLSTTAAVY